MSAPPAAAWTAALAASVVHVGQTALAGSVEVGDAADAPPLRHPGAFVPLVAGEASAQIGLVGDEEPLRALAAMLLGIPAAEVAAGDVADAIGEIANMIAGGVKTRMLAEVRPLVIGLPVFVHGGVDPGERLTAVYRPIRFGDVTAHVALLLPRSE